MIHVKHHHSANTSLEKAARARPKVRQPRHETSDVISEHTQRYYAAAKQFNTWQMMNSVASAPQQWRSKSVPCLKSRANPSQTTSHTPLCHLGAMIQEPLPSQLLRKRQQFLGWLIALLCRLQLLVRSHQALQQHVIARLHSCEVVSSQHSRRITINRLGHGKIV